MRKDDNLEATIARLRTERAVLEREAHDVGKVDGLASAPDMTFDQLSYAVGKFQHGTEEVYDYQVYYNRVLGSIFLSIRETASDKLDYARLRIFSDVDIDGRLGPEFLAYLVGWRESVAEFWSKVKGSL